MSVWQERWREEIEQFDPERMRFLLQDSARHRRLFDKCIGCWQVAQRNGIFARTTEQLWVFVSDDDMCEHLLIEDPESSLDRYSELFRDDELSQYFILRTYVSAKYAYWGSRVVVVILVGKEVSTSLFEDLKQEIDLYAENLEVLERSSLALDTPVQKFNGKASRLQSFTSTLCIRCTINFVSGRLHNAL